MLRRCGPEELEDKGGGGPVSVCVCVCVCVCVRACQHYMNCMCMCVAYMYDVFCRCRCGVLAWLFPRETALRAVFIEELQQKSEEELKLWIQGALKQTAPTAPVQFAQSPSEEKPGEGEGELKATSPEREPESVKEVKEKGELYEVVYDSVWIRREPDAKAARVSKRIKRPAPADPGV